MDQQKMCVALTTVSLLVVLSNFSAVFGCTQLPPPRARNLTVTVSNFALPVSLAYSTNPAVVAQLPAISRSEQAARTFTENLVSEAIRDVLLENGRRAGLLDLVTMAILDQINVRITYEPLSCAAVAINPATDTQLMPGPMNARDSCFIVGSTVTTICPPTMMNMAQACRFLTGMGMHSIPVPNNHLSITGSITVTNVIMSNWSLQQWQNVLNRMMQLFDSTSRTELCRSDYHCQLKWHC